MPWILAAAGLGLIVWGLWSGLAGVLSGARPSQPRGAVTGLTASWISLTGLALTPRQLTQANWAAAGIMGVLTVLITHNPLMGAALAMVAYGWPEGAVRAWARRQWAVLDKMALNACTSVQFALEDRRPVLPVLENLYLQSSGVWHRFLEPCLTAERAGVAAFEARLKDAARSIRHIELQLVADVLAAERDRGNTAHLLADILRLWGQRVEADARRRGQIRSGTFLARALINGAFVILGVLWLANPTIAQGARHGLGFFIIGIGTGLLALGAWIMRQAQRQAEQI